MKNLSKKTNTMTVAPGELITWVGEVLYLSISSTPHRSLDKDCAAYLSLDIGPFRKGLLNMSVLRSGRGPNTRVLWQSDETKQ